MANSFATKQDVISVSGATYTTAEQERIDTLLPLVSDALRIEARRVNKNLDEMAYGDDAYANLLMLVTCDIVIRAMRQTVTGDPMAQESQAALGYSWSGTYAIPGGGIANAIMKNDLKRHGLRWQQLGVIDLCPDFKA